MKEVAVAVLALVGLFSLGQWLVKDSYSAQVLQCQQSNAAGVCQKLDWVTEVEFAGISAAQDVVVSSKFGDTSAFRDCAVMDLKNWSCLTPSGSTISSNRGSIEIMPPASMRYETGGLAYLRKLLDMRSAYRAGWEPNIPPPAPQ